MVSMANNLKVGRGGGAQCGKISSKGAHGYAREVQKSTASNEKQGRGLGTKLSKN